MSKTKRRQQPQIKLDPRHGHYDPEDLDTTPIEMPLGSMHPTPINDLIAKMVHDAISQEKDEEFESYEESQDFEDDDESSLLDFSPYELIDLQPEAEPSEASELQPEDPPAASAEIVPPEPPEDDKP